MGQPGDKYDEKYKNEAEKVEKMHPGLMKLDETNKYMYGTSAIENMLSEDYELYSGIVQSKYTSNVSLSIILNKIEKGKKKIRIVDQRDEEKNLGRPLLMLLTNNGNLFVNM